MNIADLIMALQQGKNPNAAMLAAASGDAAGFPPPQPPDATPAMVPPPAPAAPPAAVMPPVPEPRPRPAEAPPGVAPTPPVTATPEGVKTPVTNPMPAEAAPRIIQSPPDLSNMYMELIKKSQNAQALDSGASLIAAGFSKYPEIRTGLIHGAMNKAGQQHLTSDDIVKLQGLQVKNQALQIRQAAKVGLMKQYGLSRDTVDYLDASDKLDEVIRHKNTQNLVHVSHGDGSTAFYDSQSGKKVVDTSAAKATTGIPIKTEEGPTIVTDPVTGAPIGAPVGGLKPPVGIPVTDPSTGQTTLVDPKSGAPIGGPQGAPKVLNAEDKAHLADINKERAAKSPPEAPMSTEDYLKTVKRSPGVSVNVSPDGQAHPTPPSGMDYRRYPPGHKDAGKVATNEKGETELVPIGGGPAADTLRSGAAAATKSEKELSDAQKKENKAKIQDVVYNNNVGRAVRGALDHVHKPGVTGFGSEITRTLAPGGHPARDYDSYINTIKANSSVTALKQMRESSPTGGALGNVTDFENKMLSGLDASLEFNVSSPLAEANLIRKAAVFETLMEQQYDDKKDPDARAKFDAALARNVRELEIEQQNKKQATGQSKYKVVPRSP